MYLQAFVASADKNGDNGMDFEEFEGFGDFGFVFLYGKVDEEIWQGLGEALQSSFVCDVMSSRDDICFPVKESNMEGLSR